jgi:undecaprenyl-diphosphatase
MPKLFYMNYFEAIILGLIQGLTEFLPVSSSGHLVLSEHLMDLKQPGVVFELIVHLGTLLSVLVYFRKRILLLIKSLFIRKMTSERKMILFIVIGTVPAAVAGYLLSDFFEEAFSSPMMTSAMLVLTGLILISTGIIKPGLANLNIPRSVIIGIGQAMAILPGISRSGTTIAAGLFTGVTPLLAAEFSFLLAIPAIGGAIIFKIKELLNLDPSMAGQYTIGALTAFISGLFAVYILLGIVKKGKFKYFGVYCIFVGILGLIYFY